VNADEAQREIVSALTAVANIATPREFQTFFGGIIGNVVGNMSEEYWRQFREVKPCGIVGCDCHLTIVPVVMKALEAIREDHNAEMSNHFSA